MSLLPRSMAHHRAEDKQIGAAVSSSSSLESVNSVDVDVSLGSVEPNAATRASMPNLVTAKPLDEPIKDWQNIIQPLLTGERDGSGNSVSATFQAWLDLFSTTPQLFNQSQAQGTARTHSMPSFPVPPPPPLPVQVPQSRKTKKSSSPTIGRPLLPSRPPDYSALLGSSPPSSSDTLKVRAPSPPTVFSTSDRYRCYLEAATSMMTQHGEDTLTYLNKGQFYGIVFEARPESNDAGQLASPRQVQSVVSLVFREEKDEESELQHWSYWHSQQPNPLLRAFDVDRKSASTSLESIDDLAHNATSFIWNSSQPARATLRVNCLSTEFSPQKGVRGMPLFLQVDTFDNFSADAEASHRCYCKIKVFRDKGAERKNKDESKSADRRMAKILKQQQHIRRRGPGHHRSAPFPSSTLASSTVHEATDQEAAISAGANVPVVAHAAAAAAVTLPAAAAAAAAGPASAWPGPQRSLTNPSGFFQAPSKVTILTTTSTLGRRPVHFNPSDVHQLPPPPMYDASAAQSQLCALIQQQQQQQQQSHVQSKVC
eukprot:scpid71663/ scgid12445/ Grainyhead-like protein 2 homolog; Brother of mammalian grainyhead; Transcription factor CP2-like 3